MNPQQIEQLAEQLARAALQGFFGDAHSFSKMTNNNRKQAVRQVERMLHQLGLVDQDSDSFIPAYNE